VRLHPLALALLAAALSVPAAMAAPWPSPRPGLRTFPPAVGAHTAPRDATRAVCGTNLDAVMDELARSAAREPVTPLSTTYSQDVDGIAVLEDDGTFFYPNSGGAPVMDIAAVCRAFYRTHGDDYDQIACYVASSLAQFIVAPTALAASWMVRNGTQGLGVSMFDVGASVGSPSRLQAFLTMNSLARYPADPDESIYSDTPLSTMDVIEHEFGHQWLAYVWVDSAGTNSHALLGRDWQHWNFFTDSDGSLMGGNEWVALPPDSFHSTAGYATFGVLDQYLMGLRTRAEVDSFFVVDEPDDFDPPGLYTPPTDPLPGLGCDGRATWWALDDIERVNGPRVPDGSVAQRNFRVAFALVVPHGTAPTPADLMKLQAIRTGFPQRFLLDTQGRGTVDVTLDSRAGDVRIVHAPLHDTEDTGSPRLVSAAVSIEGGGLALAVDPGSVRVHWRTAPESPFAEAALTPAGPDSFAVLLPPLPPGTVQYWLSAASDSAGIGAQLPAAGPAAPFTFTVGPDLTPPLVTHVPVPRQGYDRLPQTLLARVTDNVGVDSVWCEAASDGGPALAIPAAQVGADSFTVTLGSGLANGRRVAYRFVARDASAAHHVAASNAAFDTLRVVHDWFDDFENPASNYATGPVLWSWRNQWHTEERPGPPGSGTAWHCGGADGAPYGPHGDAALVTPYVYGIVPGTTFSFDERHALEPAGPATAYDGARLELQVGTGAWQAVQPLPGYTHTMVGGGMGLGPGAACWSGDSQGWIGRSLDLSPWAPGPVRLRVRQVSDDLVGFDGTWVDRVRVHYPDDPTASAPPGPVAAAVGAVRPNPSRGAFALPLSLPEGARVEWSLHDVQGRRVAQLWNGAVAPGRSTLSGAAPATLSPGLYFSRVVADGRALATQRVVLTR
jgi:hypothetical protein